VPARLAAIEGAIWRRWAVRERRLVNCGGVLA